MYSKYSSYLCKHKQRMRNSINAIQILRTHGIQPSKPRIAICEYIMTHHTHPTVEDVYKGLCTKIASLSLTTVYNTLRLFSEHGVAQMITINDHKVCYDGNTTPHVHFFCKHCGRIIDLFEEPVPTVEKGRMIGGNVIQEAQLYYKGVCSQCKKLEDNIN